MDLDFSIGVINTLRLGFMVLYTDERDDFCLPLLIPRAGVNTPSESSLPDDISTQLLSDSGQESLAISAAWGRIGRLASRDDRRRTTGLPARAFAVYMHRCHCCWCYVGARHKVRLRHCIEMRGLEVKVNVWDCSKIRVWLT